VASIGSLLDTTLKPSKHVNGSLQAFIAAEFAPGIDYRRKSLQAGCVLPHVVTLDRVVVGVRVDGRQDIQSRSSTVLTSTTAEGGARQLTTGMAGWAAVPPVFQYNPD
jgi:hypothetical protein